jgi:hypothetical protein
MKHYCFVGIKIFINRIIHDTTVALLIPEIHDGNANILPGPDVNGC